MMNTGKNSYLFLKKSDQNSHFLTHQPMVLINDQSTRNLVFVELCMYVERLCKIEDNKRFAKKWPTLHNSFFHNLYIKDVHEGVKPYQCSACPAAFSQRSKMILHYESIHEGKKPHKCSQCDKSFAQKNQLNSHVTGVHEGKKPFDCPICGTTFKRKHQVKY